MDLREDVTGVTSASDGFRNKAGRANIENEEVCRGPRTSQRAIANNCNTSNDVDQEGDESCINGEADAPAA